MTKKIGVLAALVLNLCALRAQAPESLLAIRNDVEFLADSLCAGRATGTAGAFEAATYIGRRFAGAGLQPFEGGFYQSFPVESLIGRNVVGLRPGWADKYIIVAAHYDHLGILSGALYPGADSNASGVAALLGLLGRFRSRGVYSSGIIFVALDGHRHSMAGAEDLWRRIDAGLLTDPHSGVRITRRNITMFVNLDMLGATISPIHAGRPDYLIMLGAERWRQHLVRVNADALDLGFDYYGSASFTDMFLNRVGDQKVFRDRGIPVAVFTSGITTRTNRQDDGLPGIDIPVLTQRTDLIFRWLDLVIPQL